MSQAPQPFSIRSEDYPDAPEWFFDFARLLNDHATDVQAALNKGLTLQDNGQGEYITREFTTGASVAVDAAPFPLSFTPKFQATEKPKLLIVDVQNVTDPTAHNATACFPTTTWDGKLLSVRFITGLSATTAYRVIFRLEP